MFSQISTLALRRHRTFCPLGICNPCTEEVSGVYKDSCPQGDSVRSTGVGIGIGRPQHAGRGCRRTRWHCRAAANRIQVKLAWLGVHQWLTAPSITPTGTLPLRCIGVGPLGKTHIPGAKSLGTHKTNSALIHHQSESLATNQPLDATPHLPVCSAGSEHRMPPSRRPSGTVRHRSC